MIKDLLNSFLDLFRVLGVAACIVAYAVLHIAFIIVIILTVFGLFGAIVGTFFWAMFKVAFMF